MKDVILGTIFDTLKLIPFLFVAFIIMEFIEHKFSQKGKEQIEKSGKFGPLFGSMLGAIPQCGFSVMATNLYATRIITLGTLLSIYLSTSDEMLPILISEKASFLLIFKILITKIVIGIIAGFLIDFVLNKRKVKKDYEITHFCETEHCDCEHSILKSVIKHTINITLFIFIITFALNASIHFLGTNTLEQLFLKDTFFAPFISSLIGLIPNCASSVIITELYLNGALSFATTIAGLLTSSGVALIVLFKMNKDLKENFKIIFLLYVIGVISGIILELLKIIL